MREVYYRAWHKEHKIMCDALSIDFVNRIVWILPEDLEGASQEEWKFSDIELMQYTGLKDKNGKEIYEFMELNHRYEVNYIAPKYILIDISSGDIEDFNEDEYTITKEYTKI